jgi:phosphate acetyltransferase
VFRPLTTASSTSDIDLIVDLLSTNLASRSPMTRRSGAYEAAREDVDEALHIIVERFGQLTDRLT